MSPPRSRPEAYRAEYVVRVNRVIDHIERNLDQPLSLSCLAEVAHFSPYHFHRIFGLMVGETLGHFVQRLRVERAATMLLANMETSVTEVALDCGFSSPATFARTFKEAFGMSATAWRKGAKSKICEAPSKIRKAVRNLRNAGEVSDGYIDPQTNNPTWRYTMSTEEPDNPLSTTVTVRDVPAHHVIYLRHVGPYGQTELIPRLIRKLRSWAMPRGLLVEGTQMILVAHDNPNITEEDKLRLSVCLTVPEGTPAEGEYGIMTIPGGACAVARFEIPPRRIAEAWAVVVGGWLPQSGYQPDDRSCYEIPHNDPREHPEGKIIMDIHVPVRPL
jgi:AraC family transcriptional regulator